MFEGDSFPPRAGRHHGLSQAAFRQRCIHAQKACAYFAGLTISFLRDLKPLARNNRQPWSF